MNIQEIKIGIIGLPNVGKTTFFNYLTKNKQKVGNYFFTTIDPNIGNLVIRDKRFNFLSKFLNIEKIVYPAIKVYDIAGLIENASKNEGLGNKFLSKISEVDLIIHLVRCFNNKRILHIKDNIDPLRDIEIINLELFESDYQKSKNLIEKNEKKRQFLTIQEKDELKELKNFNKFLNDLNLFSKNKIDNQIFKKYQFLTIKPQLFILNIDEDSEYQKNISNNLIFDNKFKIFLDEKSINWLNWNFLIKTNDEFFHEIFIKKILNELNMSLFFTFNKDEIRGWLFNNEQTAWKCSRFIHSDFQKKFIAVEIYRFDDLWNFKNCDFKKLRHLIKIEGKNYKIKDGDICFFKFGR
jgi:ribosome-binding ATPase